MGEKTKIEWTDASWSAIRARNLATGKVGWHCEHVTSGCEHCYSETLNKVYGTKLPFKPGHRKDVEIFLDEKMLLAPLRWKKPRMVFVCSMTDLFADFVTDEWIDRCFAVMALAPQHTFQVLTKRPERMRAYLTGPHRMRIAAAIVAEPRSILTGDGYDGARAVAAIHAAEPLPNVWLGVSCEDQATADERIPLLLQTPAGVRFISAEPLLSPIRLMWAWLPQDVEDEIEGRVRSKGLDWVIVGGESGRHARPAHPNWVRSLREQCTTTGVPFFFKQWGEWAPDEGPRPGGADPIMEARARAAWFDGKDWRHEKDGYSIDLSTSRGHGEWVYRLGKKSAGALLDAREWREFPVPT